MNIAQKIPVLYKNHLSVIIFPITPCKNGKYKPFLKQGPREQLVAHKKIRSGVISFTGRKLLSNEAFWEQRFHKWASEISFHGLVLF